MTTISPGLRVGTSACSTGAELLYLSTLFPRSNSHRVRAVALPVAPRPAASLAWDPWGYWKTTTFGEASKQPVALPFQQIGTFAAHRLCGRAASRARPLRPVHHARNLTANNSATDRPIVQPPLPPQLALEDPEIGPRHPCWTPSPACSLIQITADWESPS
jgi:hypothetical protein